ncbi:MAG: hypothetical protein A2901_04570 [Elusimicrobia bacterium RIFCSPLOWO2_01_FULL_54_10]|nr:MAG: hypothetical protein A2901_04570 [Elusimicrobia bacterium RIFCSPLOWO2_01_FULL_54_10]
MKVRTLIFLSVFGLGLCVKAYAFQDVNIKQKVAYKKSIRTRMPPSIFQDWVQKEFQASSSRWQTSWQTFVVDDQDEDEYFVIARSQDRPWALGVERADCEKPQGFDTLLKQVKEGGTPLHMDCIVGIKKERSFFRYQVTVYEPMYPFWKSPCYVWNLPPGSSKDEFYEKNYTLSAYSDNLRDQVYNLVQNLSEWRPPKTARKISAMKGSGQELIGGESDLLTDEERKLPIKQQEKILENRRKDKEKEEKKKKKSFWSKE